MTIVEHPIMMMQKNITHIFTKRMNFSVRTKMNEGRACLFCILNFPRPWMLFIALKGQTLYLD